MMINRTNNFTLLRYILALCIFCNHLCYTMGEEIFLCNGAVFVYAFFAISGILVFNSYVRTGNLKHFAMKRFLRIYPAYFICILFCLMLGGALTTLPLKEFVSHPETLKYAMANLCFLNYLQPTLPGVFENNAMPYMDSSLWTMKVEVMFYLSIPFVHEAMKRFGSNKTLLTIIGASILYNVVTAELYQATGIPIFYSLNHQILGELAMFYTPVLMLINRERIEPWLKWLAMPALCILILQFEHFCFSYANPITISILVIAFAFECKWLFFTARWRDLTYEFYLFRFPVLQVIVLFGTSLMRWQVAAIALPAIFAMALLVNMLTKRFTLSAKQK